MQTSTKTSAACPRIFSATEEPALEITSWIAEGTDGHFYRLPAEAGGWLRRVEYRGPIDTLVELSVENATNVAWYVYGDIGSIRILAG